MDWRSRVFLFLMFISVAISGHNEGNIAEPRIPLREDSLSAAAINEFGFKMLKEEINRNTNKNVVLSPTGIAGLLAMTLLGSAGDTYTELAAALGFSQDILRNRVHHEEFGELLHILSNSSSKILYADAIFVEPRTRVRDMYRQYLHRVYGGDARTADFADAPLAKDTINEWIRNNTNGKIEEFLKEPLPADTKVALLSALYFSGQWAHPFLPQNTAKMPFKSPSGEVMADLMLNFGQFKYIFSKDDGLQMIALPYNDSTTTMYVLKPHKQQPLSELLGRLNYSKIDQLVSRMTTERSVIRFPKMDIKSSAYLEKSLKALGLNAMFSPIDANFALMIDVNNAKNSTEEELLTRITFENRAQDIKDAVNSLHNPGVHVDTVLHDVRININEYGTEAVAATGGFLTRTAEQFYVNSPFYMFIRNEETQLVTFSAAIFNPTE